MPFRSIPPNGILTPDDLEFLQSVYEAAAADIVDIDDITMHEVVGTLITYYQTGERDRDKLVAMAIKDMKRLVG